MEITKEDIIRHLNNDTLMDVLKRVRSVTIEHARQTMALELVCNVGVDEVLKKKITQKIEQYQEQVIDERLSLIEECGISYRDQQILTLFMGLDDDDLKELPDIIEHKHLDGMYI